ncbi:baseplate J-like protein, partial [Pseudomonas syringae pv. actinidiae ICMP 19101]
AASGSVRFSAAAGAVLDVDTVLQFSDGRFYRVTKGVTTVAGNNTTTVEAVDAGVLGNADAGLVMTAVQPVEGIDSTFTVIADGLTGGIPQESIELLRARVVRSYRVIPHGGNQDDYVTWALELPGVTRAWCVRRYMGPGTVAVFFMRDDEVNPIPDAGQLAEMAAYIEPLRPVTADVYVLAPVQKPVVYTIRLTPDTSAVRAAVEAQLLDLHNREAGLGETCGPQSATHVRGHSMVVIRTAEHYAEQLQALLPPGPAWDPERVPELQQVITGLSREFARIDGRAFDLLNEMDPATVSELVPDWERVMNLPDPCLGLKPLFADRRLS